MFRNHPISDNASNEPGSLAGLVAVCISLFSFSLILPARFGKFPLNLQMITIDEAPLNQ
jgi:hypothetical protein